MPLEAGTKQALAEAATIDAARSKSVEAVLDELHALADHWGGATVAAGLQAATQQALVAANQPDRALARAAAIELAALRAVDRILDHTADLTNVGSHTHAQIDDLLAFFQGSFLESFDALVTSDGSTVTMSLEQADGGNLRMLFSDGDTPFGSTPAATIVLTAGTDTVPTKNYVYILQSDKILTVSTSGWPAAEHAKVAFAFVPSATWVNTKGGARALQNFNDHAQETSGAGIGQGHMTDLSARSRRFGAAWLSGCGGTATQDGNDLWVSVAAGVVMQMHEHIFDALDSDTAGAGDEILVVNDPDAAYAEINSLNTITKLSDGAAIGTNKYVKFVLWAAANKEGELSPMFLNLPSGEYNSAANATRDVDGRSNFSLPAAFGLESSTGFLIAAFVCKHTASAMEIQDTIDLRGTTPATAPGSGTGGGDVSAAAAMTDNAVIRGAGGAKDVQDSGVTVDDSDNISGIGHISLTGTVDGRDVATDGTKLDGIETAADVTDATNVDAAGAVMEVNYNAHTILQATTDDTPVAITVAEQTLVGRITAGNITALTAAQVRAMLQLQVGEPFTLEDPVAGRYYKIGKIAYAGELFRVNYKHSGGTSVIFNLYINAEDEVDDEGTVVWAANKTTTTSSVAITSFTANAMAQYYNLWIKIITVTGAVDEFFLDHILRET